MPNFWGYVSHSDKEGDKKKEDLRNTLDSMQSAGQIKSYMELDDGNGIIFEVVKPGDVELGHKLVREYLRFHHSTMTNDDKPGLMFAQEGARGTGGPIHHMFNYQYDPKRDKPDDEFKDFPDIIRYIALEQPVYKSPEAERKVVDMLERRKKQAYGARRRGVM